ncbi:MAG: chemotaxis protein CheW, partial [Elusimicrobia bacterium]|nr:chemotaxis protein CheW [Candidatus Obscuribacterium magneticum]
GGEDASGRHVIITKQGESVFGVIVEEVIEVLRISNTEIRKAHNLITKIHEDYVTGTITLGERMIILLDLAKVLSEHELVQLTDLQRKERREAASAATTEGGEAADKEKTTPGEMENTGGVQ